MNRAWMRMEVKGTDMDMSIDKMIEKYAPGKENAVKDEYAAERGAADENITCGSGTEAAGEDINSCREGNACGVEHVNGIGNACAACDITDDADNADGSDDAELSFGCPSCCEGCRLKVREDKEYRDLISRLNRIEGQIRGIKGMVENSAYCLDILTQVSAATSALNSFSKVLLANHVNTCVANDIRAGNDDKLKEFINFLPKMMR